MEILLNRGENASLATSLNYVAVEGKIYIIDNHLAALWTMGQLPTSQKYNFLHIDRHYDLKPYNELLHSEFLQTANLKRIPVEAITTYRKKIDGQEF